eukprot:6753963-Pyramimonas_sp.AAC.1
MAWLFGFGFFGKFWVLRGKRRCAHGALTRYGWGGMCILAVMKTNFMLKNVAVSPPIIFQTRTGGEEKACKIPYSNQYVPNPPLARGPPEGVPARW